MRKLTKIFMPMVAIATSVSIVTPLASCSCNKKIEEKFTLTLAGESYKGAKIKESNLQLNKDSTITIELPVMKAIDTCYVLVDNRRLEKSEYSYDENNIITIKASAMTGKKIDIAVWEKTVSGIKAEKIEKTFEALETIKASDLTIYPKYGNSVGKKALNYGTEYIVLKDGVEIKDFDTKGYTFSRSEASLALPIVTFNIQYVLDTHYSDSVSVELQERLEPKELNISACHGSFVGQKITPKDLIVNATMKKAGGTKQLKWGKEYTVWKNNQELTNFGTEGYTFDKEGLTNLTIKCVDNPEAEEQKLAINVQPISLKNTVCMTNTGIGNAIIYRQAQYVLADFKYSDDGGLNWKTFEQYDLITLKPNQTIAFKGLNANGLKRNTFTIISEDGNIPAKVNLFGSILGLLNDGDTSKTPETLPESCFRYLFSSQNPTATTNGLFSVSSDFLKGAKITSTCFYQMFAGCVSLEKAPELPSTIVGDACYMNMFYGCKSLLNAPTLPATTLAVGCYKGMFYGCEKLKTAPELPATTLANECYFGMFSGCSSLETAPALPANEMKEYCYNSMFSGCSSLETAPALPANEMKEYCYNNMFLGCSSLKEAPELPATKLADYCYAEMFNGCEALKTAPALPAKNLTASCYAKMFKGCSELETAPELPATTLTDRCYYSMFYDCKKLKTAPALPAETLAPYCYNSMFYDCKVLEKAPDLPATTLFDNCYQNMFWGCEALKIAPALPAENLAEHCYNSMFYNCKSLKATPELKATTLKPGCYLAMFMYCDSLKSATKLPAATLVKSCYYRMFWHCKNLKIVENGTIGTGHEIFTCPTDGYEFGNIENMFGDTYEHTDDWHPQVGYKYGWVDHD